MPAYGSTSPQTLDAGRPLTVWNNETVPTTGNAQHSLAVCLRRNSNMPNCVSAEVAFAANPGTFAVEVQFADTNEDKYFISRDPLATFVISAGFVMRYEYTNVVAKFVRLKMKTLTNAVAVTAKLF